MIRTRDLLLLGSNVALVHWRFRHHQWTAMGSVNNYIIPRQRILLGRLGQRIARLARQTFPSALECKGIFAATIRRWNSSSFGTRKPDGTVRVEDHRPADRSFCWRAAQGLHPPFRIPSIQETRISEGAP